MENLQGSFFWESPFFLQLAMDWVIYMCVFDQCCYGLRCEADPPCVFMKKGTIIAATCPSIMSLHRLCPGISSEHQHVVVYDYVVVNGRSCLRSALAGAYPPALCSAYAAAIAAIQAGPPAEARSSSQ